MKRVETTENEIGNLTELSDQEKSKVIAEFHKRGIRFLRNVDDEMAKDRISSDVM